MSSTPTIEIPRLPDESSRAYAARVEYITLGPQRSIDKLLDRKGIKNGSHIRAWSVEYGWVDHARRYDETLASLAAQAHAEQYRRDLEDHRARYQKAGRDLYAVAAGLLAQCARAVRGQSIQGADGNTYTIPAMELTPATVATAMRALATAADLEAHALRLQDILPKLADDVHDQ